MKHTQAWRPQERAKPLQVPENKARELTHILEDLENLKYKNVLDAKARFWEVFGDLFARNYDVEKYHKRYKDWIQGRSYVE